MSTIALTDAARSTCNRKIPNGTLPSPYLSNYLLSTIPDELKEIASLEEVMVAMVISQFGLKVSVINVPSKINDSVNISQRKFSTMLAVQLRFRRRIN